MLLLQTSTPDPVAATVSFFESEPFWKVVAILGIVLGALLVRVIAHFVIGRVVDQIVSGVKRRQRVEDTQSIAASPLAAVRVVQRTRTLGSILNNLSSILIVVIALVMIVTTIDKDLIGSFALLTAALGAGLGFGAQNIVKDVLNGLFMVAEDQLGVGDVVDTGQATGVVESVGVRVTQIRDVNGTLWFVRNGEIVRVGNMSQGWSRVIVDLAVPYETDLEQVQSTVLATANELAASSRWRARIIDKPELWGLESIADDALVIRVVVKTRTTAKDDVARELRLRLKKSLDALDVKLPSLATVVLEGFEGATSVGGAKPPRTTPSPTISTEHGKPVRLPRALRRGSGTPPQDGGGTSGPTGARS
ncbi:mechanosensitive ion channel protein MscS [Rathayibacter sp. AY1E9]|jgi:small conductance mechanosensitive channel|uniref:mechanosensitive ion channel family protein n=1 Tax=unclassified Rathayibacter TaxID=2609250 RepID=UPI000CE87695|nr:MULTISPECIES: mechanosensitive ion channel family protein [unclassified Rathayibacter]PPF11078.1 mechanosensitive ion channel protein MscS [Rathayibacter sp. AY1A5]PPF20627.1 mechanosensitive ion channel protein MscS [Rathayibacter sp. AY1A7]PPF39113.1 mechanosensitive ion channel protein MscS [Rathayibacter sp. AY1A3]PPF48002.1 mechanosensitive ion channel protein MscS [Rathayibacter sp. AY1A1]PPF71212.1 mechanosensitive ion channel protein MscS [Rathayibacter sp. AY1E6]